MAKIFKKISLKNFPKKFDGILVSDMEGCMDALKTIKDSKLLIVVPKNNEQPPNNTEAPPWFLEFKKENDERWARQEKNWAKQEKNWARQEKFNKKQEKNWARQEKFNNMILERIDNIVKKNNLKE